MADPAAVITSSGILVSLFRRLYCGSTGRMVPQVQLVHIRRQFITTAFMDLVFPGGFTDLV